jgi:hypothetical protein
MEDRMAAKAVVTAALEVVAIESTWQAYHTTYMR